MHTDRINKLWWDPPHPSIAGQGKPSISQYFSHRLFLWMPRKLWKIQLKCPQSGCRNIDLTTAGIHKKTRQVIDVAGSYNIASETLVCQKCRQKVLAWSHNIITQLDIGHQIQFPCILTAMKACDIKVVRLLHQRGLGNSSTQVEKKLREQHSEDWLIRNIQYLTDCRPFTTAAASGLVTPIEFDNPPRMTQVPQYKWLIQVYLQDELQRLEIIKAAITSNFGRILKMDSTKKVVKKLAGMGAGTAMWATNIGNEHGQILNSVLTAGEGQGLVPVINGIVMRYEQAGQQPSEILYVDRDCCGPRLA